MQFVKFQPAKTISLANLLSLTNQTLAKEVAQCEHRYISYFEDKILDSKNFVRCEIGSISYVLALLCKYAAKNFGTNAKFFDELDEGFMSGECNVGEEEFEELGRWLEDAQNVIIDSSFFTHKDSKMLFEMLEILGLNVVLADSQQSDFKTDGKLTQLSSLGNFDGSVVYKINATQPRLIGGSNFAAVSKIKDGDVVAIKGESKLINSVKFEQDNTLKGVVAFLYAPNLSGYGFELVRVSKI